MQHTYDVDKRFIKKIEDIIPEPIVIRVNQFNNDGVKDFCENFNKALKTGQEILPIIISSPGGIIYSLMEMISMIESCPIKVVTIVEGAAMSCGSILFSFGQERYMSKHATLMIHDASLFTYGKTEELKADAKQLEKMNDIIYKMLAKNCGKDDNYFLRLIHEKSHADWYLDADEALSHNLCHKIGVPRIVTKINIESKLIII